MMVQSTEWHKILIIKNSLGFQFAYWKFNTDMTKSGLDKFNSFKLMCSNMVLLSIPSPKFSAFSTVWFMSSSLFFRQGCGSVV